MRKRQKVLLNMVMTIVIMILFVQLWLFTASLDAMETRHASTQIALAAAVCSLFALGAVFALIRFFLRTEE